MTAARQLAGEAASYLAAGLCVLPARYPAKRPAVGGWKAYQSRPPTADEVSAWFANAQDACCLVCGAVSGHLELIDFDCAGEAFAAWSAAVTSAAPGLLDRLVVETSPSGGWHVVYRASEAVGSSIKLAQRREDVAGPAEVVRFGKACQPRQDRQGRWHILLTLIETRGEGGLFLCAPSPGYALVQGAFTALPVLAVAERDVLLRCAWALNRVSPEVQDPQPTTPAGDRPGDAFNRTGDVAAVLQSHGWALEHDGANQHWRRPGKAAGTSATLKDRVFYVFSSNAAPFEPGTAYSPFAVYALLEHGGDFGTAAATLRQAQAPSAVSLPTLVALPAPAPGIILRTHADRRRDRLQPPPMLIAGVLPVGGLGAIVAMPGSGKTLIAVELARVVAAGEPFLGRAVEAGAVIYACPDSPASTERRMLAMPDDVAASIYTVCDLPGLPSGIDGLRRAIADISTTTPVRLVVLDTWDSSRQHASDGWAGQDALVEGLMRELRALASDLHLAVIVVHHATRNDHGRARGSVVFDARADWIAIAEGDEGTVSLRTIKCRDGEQGDLGRFRIQAIDVAGRPVPTLVADSEQQEPVTAPAPTATDRAKTLLTYLVTHPGTPSAATLAQVLGLRGKGGVSVAIADLRAQGLVHADSYLPTEAGVRAVDDLLVGPSDDRPAHRPEGSSSRASGRSSSTGSGRSLDDAGRPAFTDRPGWTMEAEIALSSRTPLSYRKSGSLDGWTMDDGTTALDASAGEPDPP